MPFAPGKVRVRITRNRAQKKGKSNISSSFFEVVVVCGCRLSSPCLSWKLLFFCCASVRFPRFANFQSFAIPECVRVRCRWLFLLPASTFGGITLPRGKQPSKQPKQPSKSHPTLSFHHRDLVACPAWGNLYSSWLSSS